MSFKNVLPLHECFFLRLENSNWSSQRQKVERACTLTQTDRQNWSLLHLINFFAVYHQSSVCSLQGAALLFTSPPPSAPCLLLSSLLDSESGILVPGAFMQVRSWCCPVHLQPAGNNQYVCYWNTDGSTADELQRQKSDFIYKMFVSFASFDRKQQQWNSQVLSS